MEKCGHYRRWREDFELVKELGIEFLRYGPPYYRDASRPRPHTTGGSPTRRSRRCAEMGITPIADLCHFGVPDWLGDFQNPDFPALLRRVRAAPSPSAIPGSSSTRRSTRSSSPPRSRPSMAGGTSGCQRRRLRHRDQASLSGEPAGDARDPGKRGPTRCSCRARSIEYFHAEDPSCLARCRLPQREAIPARWTSPTATRSAPRMYEYLLDNGMTARGVPLVRTRTSVAGRLRDGHRLLRHQRAPRPQRRHVRRRPARSSATTSSPGSTTSRYRLPVMHTETNTGRAAQPSAGCRRSGPTWSGSSRTACRSSASPGTA